MTNETDVQALFKLVPLAANHDPVPVAIRLRARNDWQYEPGVDATDSLEKVGNLLVFDSDLGLIIDMLILAPATSAEVRALGSHTLRRCLNDLDQFRPCKILFDLGDFSLNHLAERDERDEDYEILVAGDTLAAKGDVVDADGYPVTEDQIHRVRIRRIQAAKKLFQQETPSCCAVQFRSTLKLWLWRKTSLME